jgi:hypothetical protein
MDMRANKRSLDMLARAYNLEMKERNQRGELCLGKYRWIEDHDGYAIAVFALNCIGGVNAVAAYCNQFLFAEGV